MFDRLLRDGRRGSVSGVSALGLAVYVGVGVDVFSSLICLELTVVVCGNVGSGIGDRAFILSALAGLIGSAVGDGGNACSCTGDGWISGSFIGEVGDSTLWAGDGGSSGISTGDIGNLGLRTAIRIGDLILILSAFSLIVERSPKGANPCRASFRARI